jgi:hypothetical protein
MCSWLDIFLKASGNAKAALADFEKSSALSAFIEQHPAADQKPELLTNRRDAGPVS